MGRARGARAPLFTKLRPEGPNKISFESGHPLLSQGLSWMTAAPPPPPPPYLNVLIRHCIYVKPKLE